jgi:hypothetical protein
MHTTSPKTCIGRQGTLQTHTTITLLDTYSPIQMQLTYKCIVNNYADDINALFTLISLKNI